MHVPLRLKLSLMTSVLLVGTIGTVSLLVLQDTRGAIESEARARARYMAVNLARDARTATLLENDIALSALLVSAAQEPGVVAARLLAKDGTLIASSQPDEKRQYQRLTANRLVNVVEEGRRLQVAARMQFNDVDIGEVQVFLDLRDIVNPPLLSTRRSILGASGVLLVLGIAIAFAMSARITQPLRRLRFAVNALAAGDTSARVPVSSRDEVADLTRAFNQMSENLDQKRRVESAFRRYVSDHVLREVLESPESVQLHGERREISVMFIDIRQYSRLASEIRPERLVAYLNEAFEVVTDRLLDHGATVDKYLGDAILAYFGAPIVSPDHPRRALAAAIAIQRSVRERNLKLEAKGEPFQRLDVGIGIQTGDVVVGNIGSDLKMDYTAIGDPVNVANRLQALAGPGEILLTREVADRLGGSAELECLGERKLEGRDIPTEVFRVLF
jgi:class 3 adenylate cyclase